MSPQYIRDHADQSRRPPDRLAGGVHNLYGGGHYLFRVFSIPPLCVVARGVPRSARRRLLDTQHSNRCSKLGTGAGRGDHSGAEMGMTMPLLNVVMTTMFELRSGA